MSNHDPMQNTDPEPRESNRFIRETVEPPRRPRRSPLQRLGLLIISGVVIGLVASVTMVAVMPWCEARLAPKSPADPVVIPRDPETEAAEETEEELAREDIQKMVEAGIRDYMESIGDELSVEAKLPPDVLDTARCTLEDSLVTVSSQRTAEDIFRNTYTRSDQTFGLVLAKTAQEVLILTEAQLLEDAGAIVTVKNETVDAELRALDNILGMAVLCVSKGALSDSAWELLTPAILGNSYSVRQGDSVAVLGNPMGYTGSQAAGRVAYVNPLKQGRDMNFQLIQTDIAADREASGILVNELGQVVGWVTQEYNSEGMAGLLSAVSISDLKGLLENLSNGRSNAYLGIRFRAVIAATAEAQSMPVGIYISKCINDSPAYKAGLQNGDVLVAIGDTPIQTEYELERTMEGLKADDTVEITVMRKGKNGYAEMKYEVTLGAR